MAHKTKNCIYRELISRNTTQAEFARRVGVERGYINRIINERVQPTIGLAMKIAKALGMSVEDVFNID